MTNKTQIFNNYSDFQDREDRELNGVSPEFAKNYPNWLKDNSTNTGCWNCSACRDCSDCSYCSDCRDCSYCSYCSACSDCSDCSYCSACSDCSDCSYCSDCRDCSDCSDCSYCSDCRDCTELTKENAIKIPKIKNIHQKVYKAIQTPDALDMDIWHTCDTTHCRAGWVIHLAGEEGKKLENLLTTPIAAALIYKESSQIEVKWTHRFYESNTQAMADIKRCADEEIILNKKEIK